jgi:hypothetical protein
VPRPSEPAVDILIIGEAADPHVEVVRDQVERLGSRCLVIDEASTRLRLSYIGSQALVEAKTGEEWAILNCARAVWWWRKETSVIRTHNDGFVEDFVTREYRELLESLEELIPDAAWPIRPSCVRVSNLKCYQLALARELGFKTPATIITNDARSVAEFARRDSSRFGDSVLYKPLTWFVAPPNRFLYANIVTIHQVESRPLSVAAAPCQFQEYISKSYELRVTVVGRRVFAVHIDSQGQAETAVDFRRGQDAVSYAPGRLPSGVAARLQEMLRRYRLSFGAFDLVVSTRGQIFFLELNPMGQWLWLERRLDLDISGAIARLLVDPHRSQP